MTKKHSSQKKLFKFERGQWDTTGNKDEAPMALLLLFIKISRKVVLKAKFLSLQKLIGTVEGKVI